MVINGRGSDMALYEDENVANADVFVAVADDDRDNLFAGILAKNLGARQVVIMVRGSEYLPVVEKMGLDHVVSPSRFTKDAILRFISRTHILSLTRFDDTQGRVIECKIPARAACCGRRLMDIGFPRNALVCMIVRGQTHIIPQGPDTLEPGDIAIVFALPDAARPVEALLTEEV